MKTTIVPAQITTVEDRIAGNLNFPQIILLLGALFISTAIYAVLPVRFHLHTYKIVLMGLMSGFCCLLALRIQGKIVAQWLVILSRYTFRPMYHVFDKNDLYLRDVVVPPDTAVTKHHAKSTAATGKGQITVSLAEDIRLQELLNTRRSDLRFQFRKKGGMYVAVS